MGNGQDFYPGAVWTDTAGRPIQAHSAGVLFHQGVWYWYGEDKSSNSSHNQTGVSGYASEDSRHWRHLGVVLPKEHLPAENRDGGACERPKVLYNAKTGKFVMWMHLERAERYYEACAGVAIADSPSGPFTFVRKGRPIHFDYPISGEDWCQQREFGSSYRDMTLFLDDDGSAYVVYAAEDNATLYAARLREDFTWVVEPAVQGASWERIVIDEFREAPALFKHQGQYYLFSSGTTGWQPNPGRVNTAEHIFGPWRSLGDPCRGRDAESNYHSQPTCVIAAPNAPVGSFIYLGDRWNPQNLGDSRYVWLPFRMDAGSERVILDYYEHWSLDIFQPKPTPPVPVLSADPRADGAVRLHWPAVNGADGYLLYAGDTLLGHTAETAWVTERYLPGETLTFTVCAHTLTGGASRPGMPSLVTIPLRYEVFLSDLTPLHWTQGYGVLERNRSVLTRELRVDGVRYARGLGTHAQSSISYRLDGRYRQLSGAGGLDESSWPGKRMSFRLLGDGRVLFESPLLVPNAAAQAFSVDLTGVQVLILEASSPDGHDGSHFDWVDMALTTH